MPLICNNISKFRKLQKDTVSDSNELSDTALHSKPSIKCVNCQEIFIKAILALHCCRCSTTGWINVRQYIVICFFFLFFTIPEPKCARKRYAYKINHVLQLSRAPNFFGTYLSTFTASLDI